MTLIIDSHGSRIYDEAERPVSSDTNEGVWKTASVSFVILANDTQVAFETVDVFLRGTKVPRQPLL